MEMVRPAATSLLFLMCLCLLCAAVARAVLLFRGALEARWRRNVMTGSRWSTLLRSDLASPVAAIAAPPDASAASQRLVRRLLDLHAGNPEIVVVLDGPSEEELEVWKGAFHLEPTSCRPNPGLPTQPVRGYYRCSESVRLLVVDKQRGGRADCLNAGINAANAPVIATVCEDAEFVEESLPALLRSMQANPEQTVAVCAVAPGPVETGLAARLYRLGFLRTWLGRCAGMAASNMFLPAPGCFTLLSRDAVVQAGGFRAGPLEMLIRLHARARAMKRPYRIVFLPEPFCRPAMPDRYRALLAAIEREQREIGAALRLHIPLMMGFGSLGWLALPGLLASRLLLPLLETAMRLVGLAALIAGWMPPGEIAMLLAAPVVGEILVSMTAVLLEQVASGMNGQPRDVAALFFSTIAENVGYRQCRNLWMMRHLWRGFQGTD